MGAILEKTAYETEMAVSTFDVDRYNRLKISSILKYNQEIGEIHINEFGTSSNKMRDEGLSFIFTKIKILIHSLPISEQKIKLTTWCSELKGVRFYRNYIISDENGQILTETKAELAVLNLAERKIVRPSEIKGFNDFLYNTDLINGCEKPQKLPVPENFEKTLLRQTKFSDIDYNGHINNTVYADISLDCLDYDTLKNPIKEFEINYINEVLPDETLELSVANDENAKIILGTTNTHQSFIARVKF